ncbi:hypothetical protein ABIE49_000816 [Bradyrhizobium sp. OAE829]
MTPSALAPRTGFSHHLKALEFWLESLPYAVFRLCLH